jgi:hypothetical protein
LGAHKTGKKIGAGIEKEQPGTSLANARFKTAISPSEKDEEIIPSTPILVVSNLPEFRSNSVSWPIPCYHRQHDLRIRVQQQL